MQLDPHFADISMGKIQIPCKSIRPNEQFAMQNATVKNYCEVYQKNMGTFWKHYCASIPFIFEEQCRVGVALLRMAQLLPDNQYLKFYETSSEDGTDARTLAEVANGRIITLTDGLHLANKNNFESLCHHSFSYFYLGHFCEVTPQSIHLSPQFSLFKEGFDVVYENATFQFYDKNRIEQIAHVRQLMKDEGILICLEKLAQHNSVEYEYRERMKDEEYKTLYFSSEELEWKRLNILSTMKYQVDYETLVASLKKHFNFVYLLWNSTNFYEIAASNSLSNIQNFLSFLPNPFLPKEFCFEGDLSKPRKI
ncbi:MAG: hypothetical protein AAF599_10620 [Bacteroidota bacterium]